MTGVVEAINASRGEVPKAPLLQGVMTRDGLAGDRQRDLRYHGGPDRAVLLYSLDLIRRLQAEGHPIAPGATGENLTIAGLGWAALAPGVVLAIADVRLLITSYATPCSRIARYFAHKNFRRIDQQRHPGWSRLCARVLAPGTVRPGDPVMAAMPGQVAAGE